MPQLKSNSKLIAASSLFVALGAALLFLLARPFKSIERIQHAPDSPSGSPVVESVELAADRASHGRPGRDQVDSREGEVVEADPSLTTRPRFPNLHAEFSFKGASIDEIVIEDLSEREFADLRQDYLFFVWSRERQILSDMGPIGFDVVDREDAVALFESAPETYFIRETRASRGEKKGYIVVDTLAHPIAREMREYSMELLSHPRFDSKLRERGERRGVVTWDDSLHGAVRLGYDQHGQLVMRQSVNWSGLPGL